MYRKNSETAMPIHARRDLMADIAAPRPMGSRARGAELRGLMIRRKRPLS